MIKLSKIQFSLLVLSAFGMGAVFVGSTQATRAQAPAAGSVCVEISGVDTLRNLNETIRRQEAMGYELLTFSGPGMPCFRRR